MKNKILAWHFLQENCYTANDNPVLIKPGSILRVKPPITLCSWGLHASIRAIDALDYAPGPIACFVELSGTICHGNDKLAASVRKVLWMTDATKALHEFACQCAEGALALVSANGSKPDPRSLRAIEVKRAWLAGKASNEELAAAWDAARAAAWDAARAAAWAAARAAAWDAARDAAWDAARAAAWAAARDAARDAARAAAWAAARDAARDAARAAAWAAARDAQNKNLEELLRNSSRIDLSTPKASR